MFKEKRLIHFADSKGSKQGDPAASAEAETAEKEAAKTEQLKTEEQIKKEKELAKANKIKELKLKVQKSNLSRATKDLALTCLVSQDDDEIALVESLLANTITQKQFSQQLTELQDKKKGLKNKNLPDISKDIAARTEKIEQLKKVTPEQQRNKSEFNDALGKLSKIGPLETENQKQLEQMLNPLLKSGKLTPAFKDRILNLDPNSPEFETLLKKYLGDNYSDKKLVLKIRTNKAEHKGLIDRFETQMEIIEDLMQLDLSAYELKKQEALAIKRLSRLTGLDISEGTLLEYLTVSANLKKTTGTTLIQKIEYKRVPNRYYNEDEPVTPDNKKYEDEQKHMPFGLFITIKNTENGQSNVDTLDERDFAEWVEQVQAVEVVENLEHLEQKIDFFEYGQSLTDGMELEFRSGITEEGSYTNDTVSIKKIDKKNGKISLSKAVEIFPGKTRSELTFGEFSKWFKHHHAEQKMSISEAKELLKKMPLIYKNRYPDLDPNLWEFNNLPIELSTGENLIWGDNKAVQISTVDNDKVTLSNGQSLTPGQFIRFVKDNEVEKESKIPSKDEIKDKIKKTFDTDDKDKKDDKKNDSPNPISSDSEDDYERKGFFSQIWQGTTFLSLADLGRMFQVFEDYFKRRQERNGKRRVGSVGKKYPGRLGLEYQNLEQAAENEEVEKIKGELKEQGPDQWIEKLVESKGDTDVIKATTGLLCETGNFDFEDKKIWLVYNIALKKRVDAETYSRYAIRMDGRENPAGLTSIKAMQYIMDALYGKRSGENWYNANASAYNGEMNKLKDEANALGTTPNGLQNALHSMLIKHQRGEFVPAYRFEGFIKFIVEGGRCSPQDKLFYLLAGYVIPNPDGRYLLTKERISTMEVELMKYFPHMDYFIGYKPFLNGSISESRANMKKIFDNFGFNNKSDWKSSGKRFEKDAIDDFLWGDVMSHTAVIQRMGRIAVRGESNMDHDDTQMIVPGLDTQNTMKIMGFIAGERGFITPDGHANALAGYGEYLKFLGGKSKLSDAEIAKRTDDGYIKPSALIQRMLKSFFLYDSGITGRVKYGNHDVLASESLQKGPPCLGGGPITVGSMATEVREVLRKVLQAYGVDKEQIHLFLDYRTGETEGEKNKKHAEAMKQFPEFFDNEISKKGSGIMVNVVQKAIDSGQLKGFGGMEMQDKNAKKDAFELDPALGEVQGYQFKDPKDVMGITQKAAERATSENRKAA